MTVSGGNTAPGSMRQQSFRMQRADCVGIRHRFRHGLGGTWGWGVRQSIGRSDDPRSHPFTPTNTRHPTKPTHHYRARPDLDVCSHAGGLYHGPLADTRHAPNRHGDVGCHPVFFWGRLLLRRWLLGCGRVLLTTSRARLQLPSSTDTHARKRTHPSRSVEGGRRTQPSSKRQ